MKNIVLFIIAQVFFFNCLISQTKGLIVYKTADKVGTIKFFNFYFEDTKSIFVTDKGNKGFRYQLTEQTSIDDTLSISEDKMFEAQSLKKRVYSQYYDEEGSLTYKDLKNNILISRAALPTGGLIINEPAIPQINWQLIDTFKAINNLKCQKAISDFSGRKYVAWFCRDIPISNGPWKLQGLPGLILEAYTDDRKFYYEPISIEIPTNKLLNISSPQTGQKISILEYNEIMKKKFDELMRQLKLASSQRGSSMEINFGSKELPKPQELNYDDIKK